MMATCHPNHDLISSDDVEGARIFDSSGGRLGTIDHLMIDKKSGKIAYAVMCFGGFFGIDHLHFPLPWDSLKYDPSIGGFRAEIKKEDLIDAPQFSDDQWLDRHGEHRIYGPYGVGAYWI